MKTATNLLLFAGLLLTIAPTVFAGGDSKGNGGRVQVCKDADGKLVSVELLDLLRGRRPINGTGGLTGLGGYGLNIPTSTDPITGSDEKPGQVKRAFDRLHLNGDGEGEVAHYYSIAMNRPNFGDFGKNSTDDAEEPTPDQGCSFMQLAWFTKDDSIIIQPELFAFLRKSNHPERRTTLAAFYLHEAIYKASREKNSIRVQELVALMFADPEDQTRIHELAAQILDPSYFAGYVSPKNPRVLELTSKQISLNPGSDEPVVFKIKNLQNSIFHRLGWNASYAGDRFFWASLSIAQNGEEDIHVSTTNTLDYMEEKTIQIPLSAKGLTNRTIKFELNVVDANFGKKQPKVEIRILQGDQEIGRFTQDDIGRKVPRDGLKIIGGFWVR